MRPLLSKVFRPGSSTAFMKSGITRAWKLEAKGPLVRASVPRAGRVAVARSGQKIVQRVGRGVGAEEQRAVIFLFDERRFAKFGE